MGGGRQLAWTELVADLTHSRRRAGHLVIGDFFKHSTSWTPNLHTENWKQPEKYEYFEIDQDSFLKTIPVCDLFWNRVLLEKPEIGWWKHGRVGLVKLVDFYPQCIHCHIGWSENMKHFGYPELAWMILFSKGKHVFQLPRKSCTALCRHSNSCRAAAWELNWTHLTHICKFTNI